MRAPFLVRFADRRLEAAFSDDHRASVRPYRLFTYAAGGLLWAFTGALDLSVAPEAIDLLWTVRFALVLPVFITLAALTWWPVTERASELWLALTGVLTAGAVSGMAGLMPAGTADHYYVGIVIILFFVVGMAQLRALPAMAVCALVWVLFELGGARAAVGDAVLNARVFLVEGLLAAVGVAWTMEQLKRREFLSRREIELQATHDPLTGLLNRRQLDERLAQAVALRARYGHPTSLVLLDLDDFKIVNDTHGHAVGDRVLKGCADAVKASIRTTDLAFRFGGDEFMVLLPGTDAREAVAFADRLSDAVRGAAAATLAGSSVGCTAGVGVVPADEEPLQGLLERVDRALYHGKRSGKGRAILASTASLH